MGGRKKPFGVKGMNKIISGGFPTPSTSLLVGSPGTGKSTFARQFLYEGLDRGELGVYIVSCAPIDQVKETMKREGHDPADYNDRLIFIDCYSWRTNAPPAETKGIKVLPSLSDLNELLRIIKKTANGPGKGSRIIIDSVSDFLLYSEPKSVFIFLQLFTAFVRSLNALSVVIVEEGLHTEKEMNTLIYATDNTILFKVEEGKRLIKFERVTNAPHPLQWFEYKIKGEKGVEIISR